MKKIPTLFERKFLPKHKVITKPNVVKGFEWVLEGEGDATVKFDGSCCAVINGVFYKRYDAKGKNIPAGAIKCQDEPDPITGHFPCWVKCSRTNPADKWFWNAFDNTNDITDGTYEAIGKHFQGNPYNMDIDYLIRHGKTIIPLADRSFQGIKQYLAERANNGAGIEGFVFWKDGVPQCKIKSSDFGIDWKGNKK